MHYSMHLLFATLGSLTSFSRISQNYKYYKILNLFNRHFSFILKYKIDTFRIADKTITCCINKKIVKFLTPEISPKSVAIKFLISFYKLISWITFTFFFNIEKWVNGPFELMSFTKFDHNNILLARPKPALVMNIDDPLRDANLTLC